MLSLPGFWGTRADLILDVVVTSFVLYLPVFALSIRAAQGRRYGVHRAVQTGLLAVLGIVIALFEISVRRKGGADGLFSGGTYAGTPLLHWSFRTHLAAASFTFTLWLGLLLISHRKWRSDLPGGFSRWHRRLGWAVMAGLVSTVVTSIELYVVGMVL
jgi:hypothetical protein